MASPAIGRNIQYCMVWVRRLIVIVRMATRARVRRVRVIPLVASITFPGNSRMRPRQWIVIIMIEG